MHFYSLLLCFSLLLVTTACENDGDFLPPIGTVDPGTNPPGTDPPTGTDKGELPGVWKLGKANTSLKSKNTFAGTETVTEQVGVLKDSSDYSWTITANPNQIRPSGSLTIELTSISNGINIGAVDVAGDVTLNAITTYERNGGTLVVDNLARKKYNATILELNDSIFNLYTEYSISLDAGGIKSQQDHKNTYYFTRK